MKRLWDKSQLGGGSSLYRHDVTFKGQDDYDVFAFSFISTNENPTTANTWKNASSFLSEYNKICGALNFTSAYYPQYGSYVYPLAFFNSTGQYTGYIIGESSYSTSNFRTDLVYIIDDLEWTLIFNDTVTPIQ